MAQLDLEQVTHWFSRSKEKATVLQSVNLQLASHQIFALVGESGSGKTTLGKVVVGLIEPQEGTVRFNGRSVSDRHERKVYRKSVQLVHQDPYASLNPTSKVLDIIGGGLLRHGLANRKTVRAKVKEILADVGLPANDDFLLRYPNQLSGGQRQRVSIGRAIAVEPEIVVADEAVSMLDVSMRVSILDLLLKLNRDRGVGCLFITHDFGVVRYFAEGQRIGVMYRGALVETGPCEEVIAHPNHPYTKLLLASMPVLDPRQNRARPRVAASAFQPVDTGGQGCPFRARCPYAQARCSEESPTLDEVSEGHAAACFFPE